MLFIWKYLRIGITVVPGGTTIDGRAFVFARDMRGDLVFAHRGHEFLGVVIFVGSQGGARFVDRALDHGLSRRPFRRAGGVGDRA